MNLPDGFRPQYPPKDQEVAKLNTLYLLQESSRLKRIFTPEEWAGVAGKYNVDFYAHNFQLASPLTLEIPADKPSEAKIGQPSTMLDYRLIGGIFVEKPYSTETQSYQSVRVLPGRNIFDTAPTVSFAFWKQPAESRDSSTPDLWLQAELRTERTRNNSSLLDVRYRMLRGRYPEAWDDGDKYAELPHETEESLGHIMTAYVAELPDKLQLAEEKLNRKTVDNNGRFLELLIKGTDPGPSDTPPFEIRRTSRLP